MTCIHYFHSLFSIASSSEKKAASEAVKQAGYEIFRRKQNTVHGIAASV